MKESAGSVQLSNGRGIEYKAYARSFQRDGRAVLYLMATCYYPQSGWTIFFDPGPEPAQFRLMENPPEGIHRELVTYYVASWTNGMEINDPPTSVRIVDAYGESQVNVTPWEGSSSYSEPEATGYSVEFDFGEAFQDAVSKLPAPPPQRFPPPIVRKIVVTSIGTIETGTPVQQGLYVRVHASR